jgi:amino acid adenylation domain-containing protein
MVPEEPLRGTDPATCDTVVTRLVAAGGRDPHRVAIVGGDTEWTYRELLGWAHDISMCLPPRTGPLDSIVGVCARRSPMCIAAMIGVMSSGCAFLPIDPEYPSDRIEYMVQAGGVDHVLVDDVGAARLEQSRVMTVPLPEHSCSTALPSAPTRTIPSESLAYVIFTSGSSGRPKGVAIEHRSLLNMVDEAASGYGIGAQDRVLQFASMSFDTSLEEVFPCLTQGGTLVLRSDTMLGSADRFFQEITERGITVLDLPPAFWGELVNAGVYRFEACADLRLVILGGDRVSPAHVAEWQRCIGDRPRLMTSYGPTETTVIVTLGDVAAASTARGIMSEIPIGSPLPGVELYLLDEELRRVAPGESGELYIGGLHLARGYYNCPGATADRFMPNPFSTAGGRLYRTGDRAREATGGEVEILGRVDRQVKVRGYRVELSEIEAVLGRQSGVSQCAVVSADDPTTGRELRAYVVPHRGLFSKTQTLDGLRGTLPDFMLPSSLSVVDRLPLTAHGKVDYAALGSATLRPSRVADDVRRVAEPPSEAAILAVWQAALGVDTLRPTDNFFELGGHSLLAVRVLSMISERLGIDIPLAELFANPTVKGLCRLPVVSGGAEP